MATHISIQPSLEKIQDIIEQSRALPNPPNLIPLCASISSEFLTPTAIYLKVSNSTSSTYSFLFESAATDERIGRYSFIGSSPRTILTSGPNHGLPSDPLPCLEQELEKYRVAQIPELRLPPLTGGAVGYVGYDCVKYFEPRTRREGVKDVLGVPESLFMVCDTVVAVDHFFQKVNVITYLHVPDAKTVTEEPVKAGYENGRRTIASILKILKTPGVPMPEQGPIQLEQDYKSNIGPAGYKAHVTALKKNIVKGDIIQAVPSQRIARPTSLHPFNVYRHLRTVNPSPYMFYLDCADFQIVGASPEVLVKEEDGRIITHPIAGTVKRGANPDEDVELAEQLRRSVKDRAEHVMLVDLARNDVNRVCDPLSTRVDKFLVVQKFSHVQHLVSEVSGILRDGKTRFDAFRSIFPAGTVSGAPKVRAMELIADLERETRGVYAGAVGYFGYPSINTSAASPDFGQVKEGAMDTCIALRTMMVKDGVAYLQAGGGIVFDSDEEEEYQETINKLAANMRTIEAAEKAHWEEQQGEDVDGEAVVGNHEVDLANGAPKGGRVDLGGG